MNNFIRFENNTLIIPKNEETELLIIYPTDGFYLTKEQFDKILQPLIFETEASTIHILDTEHGIESLIGGELRKTERVVKTSNITFEKYHELFLLFDYVIYPTDTSWAISIFQDFWGIIAVKRPLLEIIIGKYEFEADKNKLIRFLNSDEITNNDYRMELSKLMQMVKI